MKVSNILFYKTRALHDLGGKLRFTGNGRILWAAKSFSEDQIQRGSRNPLSIFSSSTEQQVRSPHAGNILPIFQPRTLQGQVMIYSRMGCRGTLTPAVRGQALFAVKRQELLKELVCPGSTTAESCLLNWRGTRGPMRLETSLGTQPVIQTLPAWS